MTNNWHDDGQLEWLHSEDIAFLRGHGRLTGERSVEVTGPERTTTITARRAVVLATGTGPLIPPVPGLADVRPWDNRDVTGAKALPGRLLVLGGGAVGAEMAQAYRRLGCEVTVVEGGPRLLGREEPFAGEEVKAAFEGEGITVITGVALSAACRDGEDVVATLADGREVVGEEILVAVGRRPKTAELGLDAVGLPTGTYVEVDDSYRATGVAGGWLFSVGDVNGRAPLTHMGKYQARLVGDIILGKPSKACRANRWTATPSRG